MSTRESDRAALRLGNGAIFDGEGGVSEDASIGDLILAMFEASNRTFRGTSREALLANVLLSTADDLELVRAATFEGDGLDHSDAIERANLRAEYRLRIVVELARRMGADVTPADLLRMVAERPVDS